MVITSLEAAPSLLDAAEEVDHIAVQIVDCLMAVGGLVNSTAPLRSMAQVLGVEASVPQLPGYVPLASGYLSTLFMFSRDCYSVPRPGGGSFLHHVEKCSAAPLSCSFSGSFDVSSS